MKLNLLYAADIHWSFGINIFIDMLQESTREQERIQR